jgi:hypothetical protein
VRIWLPSARPTSIVVQTINLQTILYNGNVPNVGCNRGELMLLKVAAEFTFIVLTLVAGITWWQLRKAQGRRQRGYYEPTFATPTHRRENPSEFTAADWRETNCFTTD